jgi:hypothetical protein
VPAAVMACEGVTIANMAVATNMTVTIIFKTAHQASLPRCWDPIVRGMCDSSGAREGRLI